MCFISALHLLLTEVQNSMRNVSVKLFGVPFFEKCSCLFLQLDGALFLTFRELLWSSRRQLPCQYPQCVRACFLFAVDKGTRSQPKSDRKVGCQAHVRHRKVAPFHRFTFPCVSRRSPSQLSTPAPIHHGLAFHEADPFSPAFFSPILFISVNDDLSLNAGSALE